MFRKEFENTTDTQEALHLPELTKKKRSGYFPASSNAFIYSATALSLNFLY
jgi:hypothetical protein